MKVLKKWKFACASLLTVCCIGTAAAGVALTAVTAGADATDHWAGLPEGSRAYGDEVAVVTRDAAIVNTAVDITSLPNKTGVFYMYYTDSVEWSGFTFRNGNDAIGYSWTLAGASESVFPWHSICFEGKNQHMILQDNRIFSSTAGTLGGLNGTEGENFLDGMVPVEVHLGAGQAQGDASYIKIGGIELLAEDAPYAPITQPWTRASGSSKELVASMFPDGCYLAVNYNMRGAEPMYAVTDPGSVVSHNVSMDATVPQTVRAFSKALTMDLSSSAPVFADGYSVTVKLNGKPISALPTIQKTDDNNAKLTLSQEELNKISADDFDSLSFLTFSFENGGTDYGDVAVALSINFEDPPVLETGEVVLNAKDAFSVSFTYAGEADPVTGTAVSYQASSTATATDLSSDDFTVAKEGNKYTINFTKAAAEKIFEGHSTTILQIRFGKHKLRVSAYIDSATTEWGVRYRQGIDYVDGTLVQDKFYSSATIKKHNPSILSSRIFYENSVPVDKPIFIEYGTLDQSVEWALISLMSTPTISEYFSNTTTAEEGNVVSFIMFGQGRHNMQGMGGTFTDGNTVEYGQNTNMKNNVIEISLGAENPEDGYIKVNGERINRVLTRSQKDYPSGKAWVGFFFNNAQQFDFTVNTHVNAVAVTAPQDDSVYAMDLGKATDFTVDLACTSGNLTLTDESGVTLSSSDFSYSGGKLTINASYFSSKSFTRDGKIFIWDNGNRTGTAFKMAYSNSDMATVRVGYATKGALADVVFDLGVSAVDGIMQDGAEVPASNYSFSDGKLTVKASALRDEVGAQEFLVSAGGKLYPCYVYVNSWQDGYALSAGTTRNGGVFTLTGKTGFMQSKVYDLSEGATFGFNFKTIDAYYERGANDRATAVTISLFDPFSDRTLRITVYANFADDKITSSTQALFIDYGLYDASGAKLAGGSERPVAPNDGNNSAFGAHTLEIKENNGGLTLTLAGRPYNLSASALSGFNLHADILSVTTENSTDGSVAEVNFGGETGEQPSEEPKKGCGGLVDGTVFAVGASLLAAAVVLTARKKREE